MCDKLQMIFSEMCGGEVIEDCREYDADDLAKRYKLDREEACNLFRMIQDHFDPDVVGKFKEASPELIKEAIAEAEHCSFDGFDDEHDRCIIQAFINDCVRYATNAKR